MIIHELKTIFVHIPKTAGVSVVHSLISNVLGYETTGKIKELPTDVKLRFSLAGKQKHKPASKFVPDDVTQELWDSYYKFAFVRNPWARAVSEFHWRKALSTNREVKDFRGFLNHCGRRLKGKDKGIYSTHAQTQSSYIMDNDGNILLDDIYKFEDMADNINTISEKLNIKLNMKKQNSSKHGHYRDYYNGETKDIIYRLYKEDIEMFDYEF